MHFQNPVSYREAEKRVRRMLVECILFENLLPNEEAEADNIFFIYGKERVYKCVGKRSVFDRIRIKEDQIFKIVENESLIETTIEELIDELVHNNEDKNGLLMELQQTIKLSSWNQDNLYQPKSRRKSTYEDLESEVMEGHTYHPCYKSRTGFSYEDHAMYGPEAKQSFPLKWIAIKRNYAQLSILKEEQSFWKSELGLSFWEKLLATLHRNGGTFEDYTFLPIHPWQWKSIGEELNRYIEKRIIIPICDGVDAYRATQSVRTLINTTSLSKANVKLSMNMVNTSSLRTIQSQSISAAPFISTWIQQIIRSDSYLHEEVSMVILEEYAGMYFAPKDHNINLDGQLGVIWRQSVRTYMKNQEEAVPFTALLNVERDGRTFIDDWLTKYGATSWLNQFFDVCILPVWHLLVAHGIAVEAHAQNMILIHRNGWPIRVVLRDFHESVEYQKGYVKETEKVPHFETLHENFVGAPEDKYYWMSSVEGLRELIMDTLFVFHLSELSFLMEEQYGYREEKFWHLLNEKMEQHVERFPSITTRLLKLQHTSSSIYVESLLKKKLAHDDEASFRHSVQNVFTTTK
ncbi:IucA/IucC family protein [Bacillus spongiae]|uniref:IucA/IucC family protein n=1 Tax=Bacillus spongiae TaxID=2683610 RepID=A0ABU8H9N4_9BACI